MITYLMPTPCPESNERETQVLSLIIRIIEYVKV